MYHQASLSKEHSEDTDFAFSEDLFSFLDQYRRLIPEFQSLLRWVVTNGDLLPRLLPAEHIPRSTLDELISLATKRENSLLLVLALCARYIKGSPSFTLCLTRSGLTKLGLAFPWKVWYYTDYCSGALRPFHADHALRGLKGTMLSWVRSS